MNRNGIRYLWVQALLCGTLAIGASGCSFLVGSWAPGASVADDHPIAQMAPVDQKGLAEKRDRVIFSHNRHVVKEGLSCSDCHVKVEGSDDVKKKSLVPTMDKCKDCHDTDDDKNCKQCHANPDEPESFEKEPAVQYQVPGAGPEDALFSHKKHLPRTGKEGMAACDVCHSAVRDSLHISEDRKPTLAVCAACHFRHDSEWLRHHGHEQRAGATEKGGGGCKDCHDKLSVSDDEKRPKAEACAGCHSPGVVPLRPGQLILDKPQQATQHRGDWLARHNLEARLDGKACLTCHDQRHFCNDCHQRLGVAAGPTLGGANNPHPTGWINRGSGTFHGDEARRDAFACAVCHDRGAASNCVTCHRVGGPGGNPHPGGWHSNENKHTSAACAPCHS